MASIRPNYRFVKSGGRYTRTDERDGWLLNWKDHSGRWRQRIYHGNRTDGESLLHKMATEANQIEAGLKSPAGSALSLPEAFSQYLKHLKGVKCSPDTIIRYEKSYSAFLGLQPRDIKLRKIRRVDIERFRAKRLETCKVASVNLDLRQIKAFFSWCYGMEFIPRSPFVGVKISTDEKPVRWLTKDEITALYDVIGDNRKAHDLVTFYLHAGARAKEILPPRFTWANVF